MRENRSALEASQDLFVAAVLGLVGEVLYVETAVEEAMGDVETSRRFLVPGPALLGVSFSPKSHCKNWLARGIVWTERNLRIISQFQNADNSRLTQPSN